MKRPVHALGSRPRAGLALWIRARGARAASACAGRAPMILGSACFGAVAACMARGAEAMWALGFDSDPQFHIHMEEALVRALAWPALLTLAWALASRALRAASSRLGSSAEHGELALAEHAQKIQAGREAGILAAEAPAPTAAASGSAPGRRL